MTTLPFSFRIRRSVVALTSTGALLLNSCASGGSPAQASAGEMVQGSAAGVLGPRSAMDIVENWPMKQREAAVKLIEKYGQPSATSDRMLAWVGNGAFVRTEIARDEASHLFPMEHVDFLTQTVKHRVPADRLAALNEFDGSVWFHRTRGELSAECDVEEMNLLALNLAHDVITGKRTPADARAFYAKTAMAFKQGDKSSAYVTGLIFQQDAAAADPDKPHKM